jgi:hypothetical protein
MSFASVDSNGKLRCLIQIENSRADWFFSGSNAGSADQMVSRRSIETPLFIKTFSSQLEKV